MSDATSLHHCLLNHHQYCTILELNIQALDTNRPVANLAEAGVVRYMPSSFYTYSKCNTFPIAWVCGQLYANSSHTPPNCA